MNEVFSNVKQFYNIDIDPNSMGVIGSFLQYDWVWKSLHSCYKVHENGMTVTSDRPGSSSWNTWAFTDPFPLKGRCTLRIKIDHKREDSGWIGIGVIRKSFVEKAKKTDGGFKVYSKHAIFVDPSWNAHEPHFNLHTLDVEKQGAMKKGDEVTIIVDNDAKTIHFFCNEDTTPFAEGNWEHLNYEPLCGYCILTSNKDCVSILP